MKGGGEGSPFWPYVEKTLTILQTLLSAVYQLLLAFFIHLCSHFSCLHPDTTEFYYIFVLFGKFLMYITFTFVGHCLATKVSIGKLPATRGVWAYRPMMRGGHGPTTQL